MNRRFARRALFAAGLAALLPAAGLAQSPGGSVPGPAGRAQPEPVQQLQEITVTAERRRESISKVPVSITAFDARQLAQLGIHTEADLQAAVPGLIVRTSAVSTQQNFALRGQSIDAFTGSSPAVLAYVDDVQENAGAPTTFFDLSSVQVLKGPQGTLFGRNTTGGAVLYTTTDPTDSFGGYATVRVGNLDLKETQAAVNLPFSSSVLLRLAGDYYSRGGFQHDIATGEDLGGMVRRAGRATLLLKPTESLRNKTIIEYGETRGRPTINSLYSYYPCGTPGLTTAAACLYSPGLDAAVGVPGAWSDYLAAHPAANPGGLAGAFAEQQKLGPWGVDSPQANAFFQQYWHATNITSYEVSDGLELKNIAGVSRSYVDFIADQAGLPFGLSIDYDTETGAQGNLTTVRNVSDEAQVLGKALDERLSYVAGLYYFYGRHSENDNLSYFDVSPIIPPSAYAYTYIATSKNEAAYAQGTYDLSSLTGVSGLKATAGVRYTWETDGLSYPLVPSAPYGGEPSESKQFSDPSWQVGLEYQLSRDLFTYIVSRGSWRSGGFNGYSPSNPTTAQYGGNEFLPETTHDVELGAKYRGTAGGVPASLDVAVYNQWINDIQRIIYAFVGSSPSAYTANIPSGEVRGIELDGEIVPLPGLTLGMNGAYTDAFYTDGVGVAYGGGALHYGPYGDVSRLAGTVFAQVELPTPADLGSMSVRADEYAQSYEYFSNLNGTLTPGTKLPGYGLLDLRYDWRRALGSSATLSLFARNVLNRGYYTGGEAFGADFGLNDAAPGEPRTYGAELSYTF